MNWHAYEVAPIDIGWTRLKTVRATAQELGCENVDAILNGDAFGYETPDLATFAAAWRSAQEAARQVGWQGDFRHDPVVFWVPGDTDFDFGFVLKQDNNGTTYVISPVEMPHLQDLAT